MKIQDDDFIDLLAGHDVEGVDSKEKAVIQLLRKSLLEQQEKETVEISDEELAAEDAKVADILAAAYPEPDQAEPHGGGSNAASNVIPAANRFRKYSAPLALAASVALVAVLMLQTQQYPDVSDGFAAYLQTQNQDFITKSFGPARLNYETSNPKEAYESLKQFLGDEKVPYSFKKSEQGWTAEFIVSVDQLPAVNRKLKEFGLSIAMPGHVIVEIVEKQ